MAIRFDFDPLKRETNLWKHGVSFEETITAFPDPFSKTALDCDHSSEEQRFITLAMSARHRLLVVSYTEGDSVIRLIIARLATRRERQVYEEY